MRGHLTQAGDAMQGTSAKTWNLATWVSGYMDAQRRGRIAFRLRRGPKATSIFYRRSETGYLSWLARRARCDEPLSLRPVSC